MSLKRLIPLSALLLLTTACVSNSRYKANLDELDAWIVENGTYVARIAEAVCDMGGMDAGHQAAVAMSGACNPQGDPVGPPPPPPDWE